MSWPVCNAIRKHGGAHCARDFLHTGGHRYPERRSAAEAAEAERSDYGQAHSSKPQPTYRAADLLQEGNQ